MTSLTWLGGDGEPDHMVWNGVAFEKGAPVQTCDPFMIEKAKGNRFFAVSEQPTERMAKARAAKADRRPM